MKPKTQGLFPLLAVFAIAAAGLACGSVNSGTVVGTSAPNSTAVPVVLATNKVGDVVQIQDQTITLNSVQNQGGILKANFTIVNKGSSDLPVSSIISFDAKDNDGTKLELSMFNCGSGSLDGKILAGDKLKGDICWSSTKLTPFKIYYTANFLSSGAVVWEVK